MGELVELAEEEFGFPHDTGEDEVHAVLEELGEVLGRVFTAPVHDDRVDDVEQLRDQILEVYHMLEHIGSTALCLHLVDQFHKIVNLGVSSLILVEHGLLGLLNFDYGRDYGRSLVLGLGVAGLSKVCSQVGTIGGSIILLGSCGYLRRGLLLGV